jgi:hypothetical protein
MKNIHAENEAVEENVRSLRKEETAQRVRDSKLGK